MDYLIDWNAIPILEKLNGNYLLYIENKINGAVYFAEQCHLTLIVCIPRDKEVDVTSKISDSLQANDIYELLSKIESTKYEQENDDSLDEEKMEITDDDIKREIVSVPKNFKLLRTITVDLLKKKKKKYVEIRFKESIKGFVAESDRYIILSSDMDFLLGGLF